MKAEKVQQLTPGHLPKANGVYEITPAYAAWLLKKLNIHNRNFSPSTASRYAQDMAAGKWILTHQGIALAPDGTIADGQHRLAAIVESGQTIQFWIFINIPLTAQVAMDDGKGRTLRDAFNLAGDLEITNYHVSIAATMYHAPKILRQFYELTKQTRMDFIQRHRKAIDFTLQCFPSRKKNITTASVYAVVARAYPHCQNRLEELKQFADILYSNQTSNDPNGDTVLRLRAFLTDNPQHYRGMTGQMVIYQKAQRMLKAYLDGESLGKCYATETDLFPLPTDPENGGNAVNRLFGANGVLVDSDF